MRYGAIGHILKLMLQRMLGALCFLIGASWTLGREIGYFALTLAAAAGWIRGVCRAGAVPADSVDLVKSAGMT